MRNKLLLAGAASSSLLLTLWFSQLFAANSPLVTLDKSNQVSAQKQTADHPISEHTLERAQHSTSDTRRSHFDSANRHSTSSDSINQDKKPSPHSAAEMIEDELPSAKGIVSTSNKNNELQASTNQKPEVNLTAQQQLQTTIYGWELEQGSPVNYSLNIDDLFSDPDHDFLTFKVVLENTGLSVVNNGTLLIQGSPQLDNATNETPPSLIIAARDSHHGMEEGAWTKAHFELPKIEELELEDHPLVGSPIYRLESHYQFLGNYYDYDIVYCETFKFINGDAFYAAATNKTQCPSSAQLKKIGHYQFNGDKLVLISSRSTFDAQQTWEIKISDEDNTNQEVTYLTTIHNGNEFDTYTILKNKSAMEARLNSITGEKSLQITWFEYYFPTSEKGEFVKGYMGNHITNSRLSNPDWREMDSDLNAYSDHMNITCDYLLGLFESSIVAGEGEFGDVISESIDLITYDPIKCNELINQETGYTYAFLDLDYPDNINFINNEIYSYVFKAKHKYQHLAESFRINLHYRDPFK